MDIEIKAKCSRCTTEFFMGALTHSATYIKDILPVVSGLCPHCNNYVAAQMYSWQLIIYPPQDGVKVTRVPYHAG